MFWKTLLILVVVLSACDGPIRTAEDKPPKRMGFELDDSCYGIWRVEPQYPPAHPDVGQNRETPVPQVIRVQKLGRDTEVLVSRDGQSSQVAYGFASSNRWSIVFRLGNVSIDQSPDFGVIHQCYFDSGKVYGVTTSGSRTLVVWSGTRSAK